MISSHSDCMVLSHDGITCRFDRLSGQLKSVVNAAMALQCDGLFVDVGTDGVYTLGHVAYESFERFHTWELPQIVPSEAPSRTWRFEGFEEKENTLLVHYTVNALHIALCYRVENRALALSVEIQNLSNETRLVNGVAFVTRFGQLEDDCWFEFPGNVPHNRFQLSTLQPFEPVQSGLANPLTLCFTGEQWFNVLFVDEEEKWGTAVYRGGEQSLNAVHIAAVESHLEAGQSLRCGTLFIMPVGHSDPFEPVRSLYTAQGWRPPVNGIRDGVIYSCHPHGTMDAGFPHQRTMKDYAHDLPRLNEMGIDHIWLLPIFEHLDRGVYHPTDQRIIDSRYGDDDQVADFIHQAHELGMSVLFDYVPHGPAPHDPLALQHIKWASLDRNGRAQEEWDCLSFDMAEPSYQRYTTELVQDHVERFDVDGARVDCAMGGLSNWNPARGNRPSSSGLKGGVSISKAIRSGFEASGKRPLVIPENFHPVPFFAPYTDVFYDFPLYRTLFELERSDLHPVEYTHRLTRWLAAERLSSPVGQIKLRFLGNHDTVSWVWHRARATAVYGIAKAKALWVMMSTIDGMPMLYQGDEDSSIYGRPGIDLLPFFKDLFKARKDWLGHDYDIKYVDTQTPILAYLRSLDGATLLITINLSDQMESCVVPYALRGVVYGGASVEGHQVKLEPFGYAMFNVFTPTPV